MLKQRALLLLALCFAAPAQAGLFSDDEARNQIQQLEARVQQLETRMLKLGADTEQQTKSLLDLLGQIEALNGEIRKLRGHNEELAHGLQDAEKREKDFYVDLDTRLRHLESREEAAAASAVAAVSAVAAAPADPSDPAPENRAFEAAYGLFKGGNHEEAAKSFQEFLKKYPGSVHVPNAYYWLGNAQFALKNYKNALGTYQSLLKDFPGMPKASDVLFNIAGCQQALKQSAVAQKTLRQLVAKYPDSEAAVKAKKLITAGK